MRPASVAIHPRPLVLPKAGVPRRQGIAAMGEQVTVEGGGGLTRREGPEAERQASLLAAIGAEAPPSGMHQVRGQHTLAHGTAQLWSAPMLKNAVGPGEA